jgi:DNA-binding transcriptional regulator YiaG
VIDDTGAIIRGAALDVLEAARLPLRQRERLADALVRRLEAALAGLTHPTLQQQRLRRARAQVPGLSKLSVRGLARALGVNRKTAGRWRKKNLAPQGVARGPASRAS